MSWFIDIKSNNASQTCQDESGLLKVFKIEKKRIKNLTEQRISTIVKKKAIILKEMT